MEQSQSVRDLKDLRELRNLALRKPTATSYFLWGSFAICAVFAAAISIAIAVNASRGGTVFQQASKPPVQPLIQIQRNLPQTEHEIARLHDAVRSLAAERSRLIERIEQLERSLGDITASIPKDRISATSAGAPIPDIIPPPSPPLSVVVPQSRSDMAPDAEAAVPAATAAISQPVARVPLAALPASRIAAASNETATFDPPPSSAISPQARSTGSAISAKLPASKQQLPQAPGQIRSPTDQIADSGTQRTEFAIDLGGDATMDGLRSLWATIRGKHKTEMENLRPLVNIRQGNKPGTVELRLVAGPFANAGAAARICASLQASGVPCQTTVFDGQRLALR